MSTFERTVTELEALLDGGHRLRDIIGALAEVCDQKCQHVEETSAQFDPQGKPDKALAAAWRRGAVILTQTCATLERNPKIKTQRI